MHNLLTNGSDVQAAKDKLPVLDAKHTMTTMIKGPVQINTTRNLIMLQLRHFIEQVAYPVSSML